MTCLLTWSEICPKGLARPAPGPMQSSTSQHRPHLWQMRHPARQPLLKSGALSVLIR